MSVNVYLKESVRDVEGFIKGSSSKPGDEFFKFHGSTVYLNHGRLYTVWGDNDPIAETMAPFVDEISYIDWIPAMGTREAGVYRHESATGEVEPDYRAEKMRYQLSFKAKNMEDVWELVRLIKVGDIRPDQSYEGPQGGKSAKELNDEVERLKRDNARANKTWEVDFNGIKKELGEQRSRLYALRSRLAWSKWPLCFKSRIDAAILKVLESYITNSQ